MAELANLVGPSADQIRVIDIDDDPALHAKYSARIPVLTIDDDFVCGYRVDRERVRRYLEPANR